ncbi:MAG: ABC transporter permease [Kiloniellales bacterium]
MALLRPLVIFAGLLALWQAIVWLSGVEPFILPGPWAVLLALVAQWQSLAQHAAVTLSEIAVGLLLGLLLGCASALAIASFPPARRWLLPLLVISQAIPVFAIAPLLVLWLGYGMPSKIAMTMMIIYFPVTAAFSDGLRRTEPGWLDLAQTMSASRWRTQFHIRIPAALPALASGIRVATAVAPIGAVVGEWVGSSAGLGYAMLQANARFQTDRLMAALFLLAMIALTFYYVVDWSLRRALPWQPDTATRAED